MRASCSTCRSVLSRQRDDGERDLIVPGAGGHLLCDSSWRCCCCSRLSVAQPVIEVSDSWVTAAFRRTAAQTDGQQTAQDGDPATQPTDRAEHGDTAQALDGRKLLPANHLQALWNSLEDLTAQVAAQAVAHCREPRSARSIMAALGLKYWQSWTVGSHGILALGVKRAIPEKRPILYCDIIGVSPQVYQFRRRIT
jgi:hypothetical protein